MSARAVVKSVNQVLPHSRRHYWKIPLTLAQMYPKITIQNLLNPAVPAITITAADSNNNDPRRQPTARKEVEANYSFLHDTTPNKGDPFTSLNAPLDDSRLVQKTKLRSPYGPDYPYLARGYPDMRGLNYRMYNSVFEALKAGDDASSSSSVEFLFERNCKPQMAAQVRTFIQLSMGLWEVPGTTWIFFHFQVTDTETR